MPVSANVSVDNPGQGLAAVLSANVSAVAGGNDLQTLSVTGTPAGDTVALSFGGHTTAPIAISIVPPTQYGIYALTVVAGHALALASTWTFPNQFKTPEVLFECFDGSITGPSLGTFTANQQTFPADFALGGVEFANLGTVAPTTTTLVIRISAVGGTLWIIDALWTRDTVTSTVTVYDNTASQLTMTGPNTRTLLTNGGYNGDYIQTVGTGAGPSVTLDPTEIQAKFTALASVGSDNATVSLSNGAYTILFGGSLSNAAQSLITGSDPAFTIAHTNPGGVGLPIKVNGGATITLFGPLWGVGKPNGLDDPFTVEPYQSWIYWPFPRSIPDAPSIIGCGSYLFRATGPWNAGAPGDSYSNRPFTSAGAGATAYFPFGNPDGGGLPPGTYQFAIAYGASSGLSTQTQVGLQDQSGNVVVSAVSVDQTVLSHDVTEGGTVFKNVFSHTIGPYSPVNILTVAVGNALGGTVSIDAVMITRTSEDLSLVIGPDDVVTYSIPSNFITTVAGVLPPATDATATNLVDGSFLTPFDAAPGKTLGIGYNLEIDGPGNACFTYSNLLRRYQEPGNVLERDADGYPTTITGPTLTVPLVEYSDDAHGLGKGLYNAPAGYWTLVWHGPDNFALIPSNGTAVEVTEAVGAAGFTGTNNCRVFDLQPGVLQFSPQVVLLITAGINNGDGTYTLSLGDRFGVPAVYPPNPSDPTGLTTWGIHETPPQWHPQFLAMIGTVQDLRFMDWMATNPCSIRDFSDFQAPTALGRLFPAVPNTAYKIASVSTYSGDPYFDASLWLVVLVTTTAPTPLHDALAVTFAGCGTITLSDSTTFPLDETSYGGVHPIDATHFLAAVGQGRGGVQMVDTITPASGTVSFTAGNSVPLEDMIGLANTGNGRDIWLNIPAPATDAFVTSLAQYVAANLKPGKKWHVEYGNEVWNFGAGFESYWYMLVEGFRATGTPGFEDQNYWYVRRAKAVQDLAEAAFVAAGRPGTDVVRIFGTQNTDFTLTQSICTEAAAVGATIHAIAPAAYYDNNPGQEASLSGIYELLTAEQGLSVLELWTRYGSFSNQYITAHLNALATNGFPDAGVQFYEGGWDILTPYLHATNAYATSHAMIRHPRIYGITLAWLAGLQAAGATLINLFYLFQAFISVGANPVEWSINFAVGQLPGTGDPTADASNKSDYENMITVKSEVAGAYRTWAPLFGSGSSSTYPFRSWRVPVAGLNPVRRGGFPGRAG